MNLNKFQAVLAAAGLDQASRLVVGFSGGPDSVALAEALSRSGYQPVLAYVNYHDSPTVGQEEQLVYQTAQRLGFPVFKLDAVRPEGVNFEAWAREVRYRFFAKVYRARRASALLLAHQANDRAETFRLQQLRGGQVDCYGLKDVADLFGMKVVRPLLNYPKSQLLDWLRIENIPCYDDPTNRDLSRRRNRLRSDLNDSELPSIEEQIAAANRELDIRDQTIRPLLAQPVVELSLFSKLSEPDRERLLYLMMRQRFPQLPPHRWQRLAHKAFYRLQRPGSFREYLDADSYLYSDRRRFFISDRQVNGAYSYQLEKPGRYRFTELEIDLNEPSIFNVFSFPITVTNARVGDRLNTKLRQKNVRNFIKKMGVPSYLLESYPVLKNADGEVIYVPYYSDIVDHLIPLRLHLKP